MRHHNVAQSHVLLVVRVMGHTTSHTQNKHVVHLLECAQQSGGRISGSGHRFAGVANGWQFCADNAMGANVAESVDIGFTFFFWGENSGNKKENIQTYF